VFTSQDIESENQEMPLIVAYHVIHGHASGWERAGVDTVDWSPGCYGCQEPSC